MKDFFELAAATNLDVPVAGRISRRSFFKLGSAAAVGVLASAGLAGCGGGIDNLTQTAQSTKASLSGGSSRNGLNVTFKVQLPSSGTIEASSVFLVVLGHDAVDERGFGYFDLSSRQFVPCSDFVFDSRAMSFPLSTLMQGDNYAFSVPAIRSGRIYFSIGANFDRMPSFASSGPVFGPSNTNLYDSFEFDTSSVPNVNMTNVDFFSLSYSLSVVEANTNIQRAVGYRQPRSDIIKLFEQIPGSPPLQQTGSTHIFNAATIRDASGSVVRILAPKAVGLTDWAGATLDRQIQNAQLASHFWDDYINYHCWVPNRKFQCYSKLHNPIDHNSDQTVYYGAIDSDGLTLRLFCDAAMAVPYAAMPTLPRPSNQLGLPSFAPQPNQINLYHNCDSDLGAIDWGFLLGGNTEGAGQGANWASDPVGMSILVSICRGVMHIDNGCDAWTNSDFYYRGHGQDKGTADMPIFYYGKILHDQSIDGRAYALSFDDVFGSDASIYFDPSCPVTLQLNDL